MAIKLVPDVVVPAGVFAVDWATSAYDATATGFKLNRPVGILLAVGGYAGAMFGFGGDIVKNVGIASFDWAANSIVGYIKERAAPASARVARIPIPVRQRFSEVPSIPSSNPIQRSYQPEMEVAKAF